MLSGLEEGSEDQGGDGGGQGQPGGPGEGGAPPGGPGGLGQLGQLGHWMALMAEHMTQDTARLQQFLWPKLLTGKYRKVFQDFNEIYLLSFYIFKKRRFEYVFNIQTFVE